MAQHAVRPGAHHHVCRSPSSSAVVMHDLSSALVWSWQLNVRFSRILYSQSLPPTNFKLVSIRWTRIHIRSKFALTPCCIAMRATDTPGGYAPANQFLLDLRVILAAPISLVSDHQSSQYF